MIPNEYFPLITKLYNLSSIGKLKWEVTSDSNKFSFVLSSNSLIISRYKSWPDDADCIMLEIKDELGNRVDAIVSDDQDTEFPEQFNLMFNLFTAARRCALKIEETITKLLTELDS